MKYKLTHKATGEEHLCNKVTIDGFDYYVSDDDINKLKPDDAYHTIVENPRRVVRYTKHIQDTTSGVIICTNNPNIDVPKVVCNIDLTKLCYYDRRNPDFSIKEEYGYDKEEVEATGNFAKKDCACDNCFYGRSQLTEQLIKSQETYSFSEEDLISFAHFYFKEEFNSTMQDCKSTEEIFELWKEQKPKIVYYE